MASINIKIPPALVGLSFRSSKDPDDVFDYAMDFTQLLQADTIASAVVTADRVSIDSSSFTDKVVTFFVSGGTIYNSAIVKVKITTANATPRTYERSFCIKVEEK